MVEVSGNVVPNSIDAKDNLGREESSGRSAKYAFRHRNAKNRSGPRVSKFKPPKDSNEISVNRLGLAPDSEMAEIGIRNATRLRKSFWGWYILSANDVEAVGCIVKPSPVPDNPYHADIVMPVALDAEDRRYALIEYARDLAYHATFRPWGDWSKEPLINSSIIV